MFGGFAGLKVMSVTSTGRLFAAEQMVAEATRSRVLVDEELNHRSLGPDVEK